MRQSIAHADGNDVGIYAWISTQARKNCGRDQQRFGQTKRHSYGCRALWRDLAVGQVALGKTTVEYRNFQSQISAKSLLVSLSGAANPALSKTRSIELQECGRPLHRSECAVIV